MNKLQRPQANRQLLVIRYRDAYRVASVVIGFGTVLKFFGVIFGIAPLIAAIALTDQAHLPQQLKTIYTVAGTVIGALFWLVLYVLGVLASAQGQLLRATLDEAIYVCPFFTDDDRIDAADLTRLPL